MPGYRIILFYKFTPIEEPERACEEARVLAKGHRLTGRILIAKEGINATLEGTREDIEAYKQAFTKQKGFEDVCFKESDGTGLAFSKLMVKIRDEVVTLGAGSFDIANETAQELSADELDRWYEDGEDFVVLDLRNNYEIQAGYFENTVHPDLQNFRDLPSKIKEIEHVKPKKVIAVCTGGIRCEKATCLLKREGFTNLYQLKDGIHTYIERHPGKRFKGTLFVFDNRMATPVKDDPKREVVGRCVFCNVESEEIYSDDSFRPSKKVIACEACAKKRVHFLRRARQDAVIACR